MSYKQALREVNRLSPEFKRAEAVYNLCQVHVGCNPEMVYNGATKQGLDASALQRLAGVAKLHS